MERILILVQPIFMLSVFSPRTMGGCMFEVSQFQNLPFDCMPYKLYF